MSENLFLTNDAIEQNSCECAFEILKFKNEIGSFRTTWNGKLFLQKSMFYSIWMEKMKIYLLLLMELLKYDLWTIYLQ